MKTVCRCRAITKPNGEQRRREIHDRKKYYDVNNDGFVCRTFRHRRIKQATELFRISNLMEIIFQQKPHAALLLFLLCGFYFQGYI